MKTYTFRLILAEPPSWFSPYSFLLYLEYLCRSLKKAFPDIKIEKEVS
jgi:hypothetical protein